MRSATALLAVLAALTALGVAACAPPESEPPPDGHGDDADPTPPRAPELATFAVTMEGARLDDDPLLVRTLVQGAFQILYWQPGASGPACRQRIGFQGEAHFGPQAAASCGLCAGVLAVQTVDAVDLDEPDACADLPPSLDLSFLLGAGEERPADFRTLALVPLEVLRDADVHLGAAGIAPDELIATYREAGLEATHLAMVRPEGWLGSRAGLGEVAEPLGEVGWLPMLVVYRDAERRGNSAHLRGDSFMTSLWQVAIGAGAEASGRPEAGGGSPAD